jgi:hypothetical protein
LGPIAGESSVRGTTSGGGSTLVYQYDAVHYQLIVGRDKDNIITLFKTGAPKIYLPITIR